MAEAEEDPRRLLHHRAGWRVDDDGDGARYRRRGAVREGLVRRIGATPGRERWHAAILDGGRAVYANRCYDLVEAVAWIEAHR